MRILYISQYFPPEVNAPAQRVIDFSRAWQRAGHEVTVITGFPNHPTGVIYDGYRLRLIQRESVDGINVIRTYLYPSPNKGVFGRCLNYLSFMLSACLVGGPAANKADVVIATSPQLLVGLAGWIISRLKRAPLVLEVRDVWPEALAAVDAGVSRLFYRVLYRLATFLYKRAAVIITVTPGAQEVVSKHGIAKDKFALIPSGVDADLMRARCPDPEIRKKLGGDDAVIVAYVGTHGMSQRLETVLEAADELRDDKRIRFVLIGDGAEKTKLLEKASAMKLDNVVFFDQMPREQAQAHVVSSDICVVPLRRAELFTQTVPSKVYEAMACAKPIVLAVDGEAREIVESANAGLYVEPEEPKLLAEAIRRLAADPESRSRYGENGRNYILSHYDKKRLAADYITLLSSLVNHG